MTLISLLLYALDARASRCVKGQGQSSGVRAAGLQTIASARVERDPQANHGKTAQIATCTSMAPRSARIFGWPAAGYRHRLAAAVIGGRGPIFPNPFSLAIMRMPGRLPGRLPIRSSCVRPPFPLAAELHNWGPRYRQPRFWRSHDIPFLLRRCRFPARSGQ